MTAEEFDKKYCPCGSLVCCTAKDSVLARGCKDYRRLVLGEEEDERPPMVITLENESYNHKMARELQERLVQCCIDFINETGDKTIERVCFTADALQESAKHGFWQPCTDSTCDTEGWEDGGFVELGFSA